jgi:NAD(P)-dependent dehydrogenase (short-subunit alcohol dehydrogenase family)
MADGGKPMPSEKTDPAREDRSGGRLEGRCAIVTGAASGIGRASAVLFAQEGAQVLGVDLPGKGITDLTNEHRSITSLEQDLRESGAALRVIDYALECFGGIDILMNNAGVGANSLAEETLDEAWDLVQDINLKAPFQLVRAAIPALKTSPAGRIINVSSTAAVATDWGLSAYSSSKAGLGGLTRTLALELGKFGITVNHIMPGAIRTGMTEAGFSQENIAEIWRKKSVLRRLGEPIDIARVALFLASEDAGFVTGQGIQADGGLLLRF